MMIGKSVSDQIMDQTTTQQALSEISGCPQQETKEVHSLQEVVTNIVTGIMEEACSQIDEKLKELNETVDSEYNSLLEYTNEHLEKALQDLRKMRGTTPSLESVVNPNHEIDSVKTEAKLVATKIAGVEILEQQMSTTISYPVIILNTDVGVQRNSQFTDKNIEIAPEVHNTCTQSSADRIKLNMHTSTVDMLAENIASQALDMASLNFHPIDEVQKLPVYDNQSNQVHKNKLTASFSVLGIKNNLKMMKPSRKYNMSRVPQRNNKSQGNKSVVAHHCKDTITRSKLSHAKGNIVENEDNRDVKGIHAWTTQKPNEQLEQLRTNLELEEIVALPSTNNEHRTNCCPEPNSAGIEEIGEVPSGSDFYAIADDIHPDARCQSDNTDNDNTTEDFMYEEQEQSNNESIIDSDNEQGQEEETESTEDVDIYESQGGRSYSNETYIKGDAIGCKQSILNISLRNETLCLKDHPILVENSAIHETLSTNREPLHGCIEVKIKESRDKVDTSDEDEDTEDEDDDGYEDYDDQDIDEIAKNLRQTMNKSEICQGMPLRRHKNHNHMIQRVSCTIPLKKTNSDADKDLLHADPVLELQNINPDSSGIGKVRVDSDNRAGFKQTTSRMNIKQNEVLENLNDIEEKKEHIPATAYECHQIESITPTSSCIIEEVNREEYKSDRLLSLPVLKILETQKIFEILRFTMPCNKSTLPLFVTSASSIMYSLHEMKKTATTTETNQTGPQPKASNQKKSTNKPVIPLIDKTVFGMGMRPGISSSAPNTTMSPSLVAFFQGPCEFRNQTNEKNISQTK